MLYLPRQMNPFSCGPVAIAAAAILQSKEISVQQIVSELNPDPVIGTENAHMVLAGNRYLSVSSNQDGWHGG